MKTGEGGEMVVRDSFLKNKMALSADYVPNKLPNRMKEVNEIKHIIKESLEGKVTHIFINGSPGTGKTASIKYVFREMCKQSDALFCYINCFNKSTKMGALYSVILDFFKQKRPTRKMPSRRGIAYDELLDSLRTEIIKTNTKIVICLDEIDRLEEGDLLYDILQTRSNGISTMIIGISNNPSLYNKLDPRTKSRLYPLEEMIFSPYTKEEMRGIVKSKIEDAFYDTQTAFTNATPIGPNHADCTLERQRDTSPYRPPRQPITILTDTKSVRAGTWHTHCVRDDKILRKASITRRLAR